ncbi:hypothetical protein HaLaN_16184 [Haematococcus lacustris]|uniref:Uncharacterized protein n=1 Tax=Haematococcus lacustris TaxID=44745 RepID=A0A699ZC07_HAELA|nr:hypothetical protein HaLaN_16184 [Haematococcus lacustris]
MAGVEGLPPRRRSAQGVECGSVPHQGAPSVLQGPSQHLTAAALQQPSAHATYIRASAGQLVQNGAGLVQQPL